MMAILGYDGSSVSELSSAQAGDYLRAAGGALWLDLTAPDEAALAELRDLFQLPQRNLDACRGAVYPPLTATPRYLFAPMTAANGQRWFFFLGQSFLVTIHAEPLTAVAALRGRYAQETSLWAYGLDQLLLTLAETTTHPFAERLTAADNPPPLARQIELLHLERETAAQTAVLQQIGEIQAEYLDANAAHYLRQLGAWTANVNQEAAWRGRLLAGQIETERHERLLTAVWRLSWLTAALGFIFLILTAAVLLYLLA
jgi:Mg2+ and Co2+ transporter CorA